MSIVKTPRLHYQEFPSHKSSTKTAPSVYQASYIKYCKSDLQSLPNHDKDHSISNFLKKANTSGLTAHDIFFGGKLKGQTSYNRDFFNVQDLITLKNSETLFKKAEVHYPFPKPILPKI